MQKKLCSSCAIRGMAVDDCSGKLAGNAMSGAFSD
jgi:hypothetical protein